MNRSLTGDYIFAGWCRCVPHLFAAHENAPELALKDAELQQVSCNK